MPVVRQKFHLSPCAKFRAIFLGISRPYLGKGHVRLTAFAPKNPVLNTEPSEWLLRLLRERFPLTITRSQIMQVSPANFLLVCAVAAFGVAASLVLAFASATLSGSALASVEKLAFALN